MRIREGRVEEEQVQRSCGGSRPSVSEQQGGRGCGGRWGGMGEGEC